MKTNIAELAELAERGYDVRVKVRIVEGITHNLIYIGRHRG